MATLDAGMTVSGAVSAAQRVMSLPEMVSEILDWAMVDNPSPSNLAKLARTNRVWYSESRRRLWQHGTEVKGCSLPEVMEKLQEGQHRFLHASRVKSANLVNIWKGNVAESTSALKGLRFEHMEYLAIIIRNTEAQRFQMPVIKAPMVKILDIRLGHYEQDSASTWHYRFQRDNHGFRRRHLHEHIVTSLIRVIKKDFPNLQAIMLGPSPENSLPINPPLGWPTIIQRFQDEFPGIQVSQYPVPTTGAKLLEGLRA
ncbi:uncharacterized protein N7483_004919 [Penicillium malachiteum]|uniref:uncharacterized protein n=1 Tax=Penicillium malachiteum TaxID=1324776 RepID=UPI0025491C2F|nr:uncharacterized protein N7483_004919 [Penicillium malachiteum]KAJ5730411.1 hypothetical protein N7483_004919 [Penicillium malachiteum]